jgi:anti-sigma factor RsiW
MNCETAKDLLVLLNCGELSFEDEEAVETHVAACPACAAERQKLEHLDALLEFQSATVSPDLLSRCRRDLSARLTQEAPRRAGLSLAAWWRSLYSAPLFSAPWLKPAAAVTLLAIGFAGGKLVRPGSPHLTAALPAIVQPVADNSASGLEPASAEEAPVAYQPVQRATVLAEPADARVRNLLLAAVNDQDPALRVDSIDLLQQRCGDETVRRTLLGALRTDKNSGVRLKALDALRPYAQNPETRAVLAGVVLNDNSPAIRAQAIDLLVQSRDADVAATLQEVLRREENPYIRERSVHALRAMKASTGTF